MQHKDQSSDSLTHISSILGFKFHEGFDRKLEVKLVKYILIRETKVMKLNHLSLTGTQEDTNSKMLDLMVPIREASLNVIESVVAWRESFGEFDSTAPPIYIWEGSNYLLKMTHDLDFLAENRRFMFSIGTDPMKMRYNPLMLSNNLDDITGSVDPFHRAGLDAGGKYFGPLFDERLRLRKAERVLLVEVECNSTMQRVAPRLENTFPGPKPSASNEYLSSKLSEREIARRDKRRKKVTGSLRSSKSSALQSNYAFPMDMQGDSAGIDASVDQELNARSQIRSDEYAIAASVQQNLETRLKKRSMKMGMSSGPSRSITPLVPLTVDEIILCQNIANPSNKLQLAAASCIILLASGIDVPEDLSWDCFVEMSRGSGQDDLDTFVSQLNALDHRNIPRFKVTAIASFLPQLDGNSSSDVGYGSQDLDEDAALVAQKLAAWITTVSVESYAKCRC